MKKILFCILTIFLFFWSPQIVDAWEVQGVDEDFIYVKVNNKDLKEIAKYKMMLEAIYRVNRFDEKYFWDKRFLKIPKDFEKGLRWSPLPVYYELVKNSEKYVLISVKDQFVGCYEYGVLKKSFPISSGTSKNPTPIGKFKVLEKHKDHKSDVYKDSRGRPIKMPWAIKFHIGFYDGIWIATWMRAGDLPGYPASHGCVRLFYDDAKSLFLWMFPGDEEGKWEDVKNGAPVEVVLKIKY